MDNAKYKDYNENTDYASELRELRKQVQQLPVESDFGFIPTFRLEGKIHKPDLLENSYVRSVGNQAYISICMPKTVPAELCNKICDTTRFLLVQHDINYENMRAGIEHSDKSHYFEFPVNDPQQFIEGSRLLAKTLGCGPANWAIHGDTKELTELKNPEEREFNTARLLRLLLNDWCVDTEVGAEHARIKMERIKSATPHQPDGIALVGKPAKIGLLKMGLAQFHIITRLKQEPMDDGQTKYFLEIADKSLERFRQLYNLSHPNLQQRPEAIVHANSISGPAKLIDGPSV